MSPPTETQQYSEKSCYEFMNRFNKNPSLSFNNFDPTTLPQLENGHFVFRHALCLERNWSANFWQQSIDQLTPEQRQNYQIVIIPPRGEKKSNPDYSRELINSLRKDNPSPYPLAVFQRTHYEEVEYGKTIIEIPNQNQSENIGNKSPHNIYIICSPVSEDDVADIIDCAQEYRQKGVEITLIAPFIKDEREDKNIGKTPENPQGVYNGRIIKIQNLMARLSHYVNRIITFEPHSGATQAFAALNCIPLAPLSLQEEMTTPFSEDLKNNPNSWVIVRPDEGRNLVATRLEKMFKIQGVHLKKIRNSDSLETQVVDEDDDQIKSQLAKKNVLLYDDEGGTLGTIKNIVINKLIPAEVCSINICLAHARLQKKWQENLKEIIEACNNAGIKIKIVFSDSRRPLGNLKRAINRYPENIQIISVEETVRRTIDACVRGVNFWICEDDRGTNWALKILQPIAGYD